MEVPAILKNKKVLIGVGGAAVLVVGFLMLRGKAASAESDSGDGSGAPYLDTTYYSMPSAVVSTDTSNQTVSASQLLDYSKGQSQLTANMNYVAIASQLTQAFTDSMKSKVPTGTGGLLGTFNIGGTPISFDFTFKDKKAVITSPPSNSVPAVTKA